MGKDKINIFSDIKSFILLLSNPKFRSGKDLKAILRQRSRVFLMAEENEINKLWADTESLFRKSCDAFDIACPTALPNLKYIYEDPKLAYQLDPFGLWILDTSKNNITKFRDYLGVWVINPQTMHDDDLYLHHNGTYKTGDVISGMSGNGWKNFIDQFAGQRTVPPINAIMLNDRFLLVNNKNENIDKNSLQRNGSFGLSNLLDLLDVLLPADLKIPFHLFIFCKHPVIDQTATNNLINDFRVKVKTLRQYPIEIEFVFGIARHERTLKTNYFSFDLDRGYNLFFNNDHTRVGGDNHLSFESYYNDPYCTGENNYLCARKVIQEMYDKCMDIANNPNSIGKNSEIKRTYITTKTFQNRLFT